MQKLIPAAPSISGSPAAAMRHAGPAALEAALTEGRLALLALFDGFERALGTDGLRIAFDPVLNLPLWELGHIGWFEEHWLARNRERHRGPACDPAAPRETPTRADADLLYDSSHVPHAQRWQLALPSPVETRAYLEQVRESTLMLLRDSAVTDDALYFFRLVLFHEDMHREAWHFMAQQLGIDLGPAMLGRAPRAATAGGQFQVPAGVQPFGFHDPGFAFDNELAAGEQLVDSFSIDRSPVSWQRFLPFVEQGGYRADDLWTDEGRAWRASQQRSHPRHLRRTADGWQQQRFGRWATLDLAAPVLHVNSHEARAWCRWARRRLPSEVEWETSARLAASEQDFDWGQVWEWTASRFAPYTGFSAHPYRDYSAPWFDGRPVLRGASFATTRHLAHPAYRNFFTAERDDVFAGFRSCALPT